MKTQTYARKEKLKSRKLIEQVFATGKSVSAHPLRLVYTTPAQPVDAPVKIGVSVSTRNFKKAVDRNRVKRLLREAYRLNKVPLVAHARASGRQLAVFIIYTDKTLPTADLVAAKMQVILNKLIKATSEDPAENH